MENSKAKRYIMGALRAASISAVSFMIGEASGEPVIGGIVGAAWGFLGKFLRDKFPEIAGWLPII